MKKPRSQRTTGHQISFLLLVPSVPQNTSVAERENPDEKGARARRTRRRTRMTIEVPVGTGQGGIEGGGGPGRPGRWVAGVEWGPGKNSHPTRFHCRPERAREAGIP
ncbi:unnamed protein product [Calypogeia fissa]